MLLSLLLLVSCCSVFTLGADVLAKAGAETKNVLAASKSTGRMIRECSCAEEDQCIQQMEGQIRQCFDTCWQQEQTIPALSKNPQQLKQCFLMKQQLIDQFIGCVKNSGETCVQSKAGPQVPYVDINKLIGTGEQRLRSQAQAFLRSMKGENQKLVQAAVDVGTCMKQCFMQDNSRGSCFDKAGCNPKLEENLAGPVIKRCARQINWKKQASEMCDCSMRAGVQTLKPYCQILRGSQKSNSDNI
jgi:hypothetical protein